MDRQAKTDASPYVVVARRYRPQNFDELVGQPLICQALRNAIATDRVGHAYLFTGARGVGKTSTARILAKSLNCQTGPTSHPCGQCDTCQAIAAGADIDVLEIDGASNRGIDEIRQLRSNIGVRPSRARFKIYIIDEVHMLTKEAFNALLKSLEEPPPHVKYIFCTTEPTKIPVTVLSRCQRFDFAPVEVRDIVTRLSGILESEGATAEPEVLELLAHRAAGSLRDSQSLLEQLLAFAGKHITVDDVHTMLGTARHEQLTFVVQRLLEHDAAGALAAVDEALTAGVDAGQLCEQLVGSLRDVMVATVGGDRHLLLFHRPEQAATLRQWGQSWGPASVLAAAQILDQAVARMRYSAHPRVLLEIAIVRVALLERLDDLAQVIQQLPSRDAAEPKSPRPATAGSSDTDRAAHAPVKKKEPDSDSALCAGLPTPHDSPSALNTPNPEPPDAAPSPAPEPHTAPAEWTDQVARRIWETAVAMLDDLTADCAAHFDSVAATPPDRLVVRYRRTYNSSKAFCERPERWTRLQAAVHQAAGRPIQVQLVTLREDDDHALPPAPAMTPQQLQRRILKSPLVERAREMFDAQVVAVEVHGAQSQTTS